MSEPNSVDVLVMYGDLADLDARRIKAAKTVARALPEGTEVSWETQRCGETYVQRGHVIHSGISHDPGRIVVRNARTGKTSTIGIDSAYGFTAAGCRAP